jgi:hypothetical protein
MVSSTAADLLRVPVTRARLRELLDRRQPPLGEDEQRALDLLQRELQDDIDMDDDPDFAELLAALRARLDRRRLTQALYRPHLLVEGLAYPLLKGEVQQLCAALGVDIDAQEVERLATGLLILKPVLLGTSQIPRRGFFARHVVQIIYERLLMDDVPPAIEQAHLSALRGQLQERLMVYYRSVTREASTEARRPVPTKVAALTTAQHGVPTGRLIVAVHLVGGRVESGESDARTLTADGYPIFQPQDSNRARWVALREIKYVVFGSLEDPELDAELSGESHMRKAILRFRDGEWIAAYMDSGQPADGRALAIMIRLTESQRLIPAIVGAHALLEIQFVDAWTTARRLEHGPASSVDLSARQMHEATRLVDELRDRLSMLNADAFVTSESLALLRAAKEAVQGLHGPSKLDSLESSLAAGGTRKGAPERAASRRSARTKRDL